jgi:hypothetical protein
MPAPPRVAGFFVSEVQVASRAAWHRLSNIDPATGTGLCTQCGERAPLRFRKDRNRWFCRGQDVRKSHDTKRADSSWIRTRKELTEKQGGCAICGRKENLALDHNHRTKKVRAVLCRQCNSGIGLLGDDPATLRKAAEYLESHNV